MDLEKFIKLLQGMEHIFLNLTWIGHQVQVKYKKTLFWFPGETGMSPKKCSKCTKCSCEHENEGELSTRIAEKQKKRKANLQTALKVDYCIVNCLV